MEKTESYQHQDIFSSDFKKMVNIVVYNSLGFFFLDFLIPFIAMLLDSSGIIMGILFSLRTVGYLISSSFMGFLSDRFNKKILVSIGSIGRGLSYFIFYYGIITNSIFMLAIATTFLGIGAGFFWIPFNSLIAQKSHKNNRSKAYGLRSKAQGKGVFLGATLGFSFLSFSSGYQLGNMIAYIPLLIFGLANFYAGYLFFKDVDETEVIISNKSVENVVNVDSSKKNIINKKWAILAGLVFLALVMLISAINGSIARPFLIPYLLDNLSADATIATMVYIPSGLVSLTLAAKLGEIADKMNTYLGVAIGSLSGAIITFLLINTNNLIIFAILLSIDVTIATMTGLIIINLFSRINIKHRGKILSFQQFSENIGSITGPILGGMLWDTYSSKYPFLISIIVELILIPLYIIAIFFLKPNLEEKYSE